MNVAVLGYGTVGSGVVEVIRLNQEKIAKQIGEALNVKYVLDLRDFPGDPVQEKIVHDFDVILKDDSVKVVVEVLGGIDPAYDYTKRSLMAGKTVVTSNKELVEKHALEFLALAKENKVNYLFEASVGGGIPVIRAINSCLVADEITEVTGILNGTTNYMLTKMADEDLNYEDALEIAQANGYAEKNPTIDVLGYDACRKIAILASIVFGKEVNFEDIKTEGITLVTKRDFEFARHFGASIKLIATCKKVEDKVYAWVAPMMIKKNHPLYSVNDVYNGILVNGNAVGNVMFYGQGAGKMATASAVVADVVDAVKNAGKCLMEGWSSEKLELADVEEQKFRFYVRISDIAAQREGQVHHLFGDDVQLVKIPDEEYYFTFITNPITLKDFEKKMLRMDKVLMKMRTNF